MTSSRHPLIVPRRLLARVRDVMASANTAQQRLEQLVADIATDMVAEVCSVYVLRPGEVLELFATQGLRPEAVHKTRLRLGEGLVGDIAAHAHPLALADAQAHPNFAFRPETGEEIYRSFLGVPILHGGRVVGVLAVQNRTQRQYSDEELETLQTVAMVLAELVTGGELVRREELVPADGIALRPLRVEGLRLNGGSALAAAHLHRPGFRVRQMVADNIERERERLRAGLEAMHGALDSLFDQHNSPDAREKRDILEAYRMIARDSGWLTRIEEAIETGLTAEAAVQRVHSNIRARITQSTDPFLRERLHDIEDLALRLLGHLDASGQSSPPTDQDFVVIARNLGPAQLLEFDRTRLRGLVLEEGTPSSHVTIIARTLDVPVVGQVRDITARVDPGDLVGVDGDAGLVFIRPDDDAQQRFRDTHEVRERNRADFHARRGLEPVTKDGLRIGVHINAGLPSDIEALIDTGADGVGLFRTEVAFMLSPTPPDLRQQAALYRSVLDMAGADRPVTFRTLDIGGDKMLSYWPTGVDQNPALGWRAIRIGLDRPAFLRRQLGALVRAASGRNLQVMFPMIAETAEFEAARALLDLELERLPPDVPPPKSVRTGIMVEVPSMALQLCRTMPPVDFVAVGGNDLFQFLFASDRANPRLSDRYDILSPVALGLLRDIVDACDAADVAASFCGETAAYPLEAMALAGIGFRHLSVSPNAVGRIKAMIRSLDVGALRAYLTTIQGRPVHSLRQRLRAFALDHCVAI